MKTFNILLAISCLLYILPTEALSAENNFVMEIKTNKESFSPDEPIYVQWIVKNMGDNQLSMFVTIPAPGNPSGYRHPALDYGIIFHLVPFDGTTGQTLDAGTVANLDYVTPHSTITLRNFDLKTYVSNTIGALKPGLYKIYVSGSWIGLVDNEDLPFYAESYFTIEEKGIDAVLLALDNVNANVAYTQDKVGVNKEEILKNRKLLNDILKKIKK